MADENPETQKRLEDLEALVAQAMEIAKHHGDEHFQDGTDPAVSTKGVKYISFGNAGTGVHSV